MMDINDTKTRIFYFCREKFYKCMLNICQEAKRGTESDLSVSFYEAIALILCNRVKEAVQELDNLKQENDFRLCVSVAVKLAQGETERFSESAQLKRSATYLDYYHTSYAFFAFDRLDKAKSYIEKAASSEPNNSEVQCLKGWIMLGLAKGGVATQDLSAVFDGVLSKQVWSLNASLGLAESFVWKKRFEEANTVLNKAIVRCVSTNLPLVQKMKLHFTMQDWELCNDEIQRVTDLDPTNLEALKINILLLLCSSFKYEEAALLLQRYSEQLLSLENENPTILVESAKLFSRVACRNITILTECYKMVEKALQSVPNNVLYLCELGYQAYLQGNLNEALKLYKLAAKLDESSPEALLGLTLCELSDRNKKEKLLHQIVFLQETEETGNINPTLLMYLQAKLCETDKESLQLFNKIIDSKMALLNGVPYGIDYLFKFDPDFMLVVAKEFMKYISGGPEILSSARSAGRVNPINKKAEQLLRAIVKACSGLHLPWYLLAKIQFAEGDIAEATASLEHIISNPDAQFADAYVLQAQIQIFLKQFERANNSLQAALGINFEVQEYPMYHFLLGLIKMRQGSHSEGANYLNSSLQLSKSTKRKPEDDYISFLSLSDKATAYIELFNSHTITKQPHEASKLLEEAVETFKRTSEEARFLILHADRALECNDVQGAVDILSGIGAGEIYYVQARTKLSYIFLEHRRDQQAYLKCYKDMIEADPGPETFMLLGDAYLNVLDVSNALEYYERALQQNPKDLYLISKLGKFLVTTHFFSKAIDYYKEAIRTTDNSQLKLELATLYVELENFGEAELLLKKEIERDQKGKLEDLMGLQSRTSMMVFLGEIQEKSGNVEEAVKTLTNARDNQIRIKKRFSLEESIVPMEELIILRDIYVKLARLLTSFRKPEEAVSNYKEALAVFPDDCEVLTHLAKLYMQINNFELCQQTCGTLLQLDADNEDGAVMMANIAFQKINFDMASIYYSQLISRQPTNWRALVQFIEVLHRIGQIDKVPHYLQVAEGTCVKPTKDPGFCYCTALYQWYSGNLNAALRNFNNARADSQWEKQAIRNMIEICLNPDDEMLGDQFFDGDDTEYRDSRTMALKTAERLLKELKQKSATDEEIFRCRLLNNFLQMATKEKYSIERALEDLLNLASQDTYKENIGIILAMATAHTMLKQGQRAKNQLKRVVKTMWTFEDADYLERCWLLLADYYIQSSKYDMASDLLKRVQQHNKACTKAFEFSGYISEKEQMFKEAAISYESAWRFGGKTNPTIGYKLAYSLLKCKRHAEAIDVCQQVLRVHPDYPRIKKDILDKALMNLRT